MRHEVEKKLLVCNRATIMQAAIDSNRAARDDHDGCEIECVKCNPRENATPVEGGHRKAEQKWMIAAIAV